VYIALHAGEQTFKTLIYQKTTASEAIRTGAHAGLFLQKIQDFILNPEEGSKSSFKPLIIEAGTEKPRVAQPAKKIPLYA